MDFSGICALCFVLCYMEHITVAKEYCSDETFRATCDHNHVILIQNATYGLMKRTRCTQEALYSGYIGCSNDVLNVMDRECSGQQNCEIGVFDARIFGTFDSCPKVLTKYLDIDYTCVKVDAIENGCELSSHGTLSSATKLSENCGSISKPFIKEVEPGQNIQIRVDDLTYREQNTGSTSCSPVGYILEDVVRINKTICGGSGLRSKLLYQSISSKIEIVLPTIRSSTLMGTLLLHYSVHGCIDPPVNSHTWYVRDGDKIRYGCNTDDLVGRSECVDGFWDSPIINCTSGDKDDLLIKNMDSEGSDIDDGVMIGIIIGVAVLLSIIVLVCGVVCTVKRNRSHFTADETYIQGEKRSESEFKLYNTMQHPFEKDIMPSNFGNARPGPSLGFLSHDPHDNIPCDCEVMHQTKD